jgi:hypothetical protein
MDHFHHHLGVERVGRREKDDPGAGNEEANTIALSAEKRPLRSFQGALGLSMADDPPTSDSL